jgi:type II secretion system protein C
MNKSFNKLTPIILIISTSYFIASIINILLPTSGIQRFENSKSDAKIKYNIKSMFTSVSKPKNSYRKKNSASLKNLIKLKTIFAFGDGNGFVIIENKSGKTFILENEQEYNGYKLIKIEENKAIFLQDKKQYQISIFQDGVKNNKITKIEPSKPESKRLTISHKEISKNVTTIWNDINIIPIESDNKIEGFKILSIKSKFLKKIGLRKNDIIVSVNGIDVSNNSQMMKIYSKLSTMKVLKLVLKRQNRLINFEYKIN